MSASTVPLSRPREQMIEHRADHVTVGTDGSYWGDLALAWAARHAWLRGGQLEVLRPADRSALPSDVPHDVGLSHATRQFPLLPVSCRLVHDDPLTDLTAASVSSDLLVLGAKGHRHRSIGLGELVLPTVTEAHCDVLVVRGAPEAVRGQHRNVTAMVSGGNNDSLVLQRAAAMANTYRSRLRVVHAAPEFPLCDDRSEDVLHQACLQLKTFDPTPRTTTMVVRSMPHELIAQCDSTDMVVLGQGRSHRAAASLGAVAKSALYHALCPVLIVHQ